MDHQSRTSKEVAQEKIDDIVYYFEEKKRLQNKRYSHNFSKTDHDYFNNAARICEELEISPAVFVQTLYDRMGDKKNFFAPKHLGAENVRKFFQNKKEEGDDFKIEITNSTLSYEDIWQYQHELAMMYIKAGETVESILMDSSLKFFAWYRILSTPRPNQEIINKYKHIAKQEWNKTLERFAIAEGLDVGRILY